MPLTFGAHVRKLREALRRQDRRYSVRQVACRIGVQPAYLSRVERGEGSAFSEARILALARELGEDPDVLLALAGKISSDVQDIIRRRPRRIAQLIRQVKGLSDRRLTRVVEIVRDGNW